MLKNTLYFCILFVSIGTIRANDSKQNGWKSHIDGMILKLQTFKPSTTIPLRKVSTDAKATLNITSSLNLEKNDFLKCKVVEPNLGIEAKPILVIHTRGTATNSPGFATITKPSKENCFSFKVKTSGQAVVTLHNNLNTKHKFIQVKLGNSYSFIVEGDEQKIKEETEDILSEEEYRGFWIGWDSDSIKIGKQNENSTLMTYDYASDDDINFVELSTPKTIMINEFSTWLLYTNDFCPDILYRPKTHQLISTECHQVYDEIEVNAENISEEKKVLKKVVALAAEFETEKSEKSNELTADRIEEYYLTSLDRVYHEKFLHLVQKCAHTSCDQDVLEQIETTMNDVRKNLQEKTRELAVVPNCSEYATYDDALNSCKCNVGYAGNGVHCGRDSDSDGIPDDAIEECVDTSPSCQKDNCRSRYNPDQIDIDQNDIGDECEEEMDDPEITEPAPNEEQCIEVPSQRYWNECTLKSDFQIPYTFDDKTLEINTFMTNEKTDKIVRLSWNKQTAMTPKFMLNILNDKLEKNDLKVEYNMFGSRSSSNLFWKEDFGNDFKGAVSYRFVMTYDRDYVSIIIESKAGNLVETSKVRLFDYYQRAEKLCLTSDSAKWLVNTFDHKCN